MPNVGQDPVFAAHTLLIINRQEIVESAFFSIRKDCSMNCPNSAITNEIDRTQITLHLLYSMDLPLAP